VFRADATKADALRWIEEQIEAVRAARPVETRRSRMLFATFAASVLARRTASGEIESESTVEKWQWQLDRVLTDRWAGFTWGHLYFDEITRDHCEKWWKYLRSLQDLPRREGRLAETTCNDLIGLFRFLFKLAVAEDVVAKSPAETTLPYFRKRTPTYTRERPNRYTPSQAAAFLDGIRRWHPEHYAMSAIGFGTGVRPSQLRPLRRRGPTPDVLWNECAVVLRRSNSRKQAVMLRTKTEDVDAAQDAVLYVSPALIEIMRWHEETQLVTDKQKASDLLFPSVRGGMRARSVLDKPFADVATRLGLPPITAKGMRRSNKDALRMAKIDVVIAKAVTGHRTDTMHSLYSTVTAEEGLEASTRISASIGVTARPAGGGRLYEVAGVSRTLEQWATESGIGVTTLRYRLSKGMSMADAIARGHGRSGRRLGLPAAAEGPAFVPAPG
jgi:integrase